MKFSLKNNHLQGLERLESPLLNKSTAFTAFERTHYQLHGLLPSRIETIEEQLARTHMSFEKLNTDMEKYIFLRALQDRNETLFYRFLFENPIQTMPIIYTPTVGFACIQFSQIYRRTRGLYLSYPERQFIPDILKNIKKQLNVKITVITDGERILGLGDQGVGGLGIPIGKLSLYCLLGGLHPANTLPIILDVGTNNTQLLNDPCYLGWRHERLTGQAYLDFVDECVSQIVHHFPDILIQFEDFAQHNAHTLLNLYRHQICCFNDDIQGTAAVASATILSAIQKAKIAIGDLKIVIFGAGSAGCGIASILKNIFKSQGVPENHLNSMFYLIDRQGLLHDEMANLLDFQKPFVQEKVQLTTLFNCDEPITLSQVIDKIQAQILIGVSGQFGQFTEEIIRKMASYTPHPIIMPLSNPNDKCEANPNDILQWTNGQAIIATGSPFNDIVYQGCRYQIAQCNNAYIFPGVGLGVIAGKIKNIPNQYFEIAAWTLAKRCPTESKISDSILPALTEIRSLSQVIAQAIVQQAIEDGHSPILNSEQAILQAIEGEIWYPDY